MFTQRVMIFGFSFFMLHLIGCGQQTDNSFLKSQSSTELLDLLIVVDDSGSMTEEQQNLSKKLEPLLSYVSNSDWNIGIVTTDPDEGCLRGLIRKSDPDSALLFEKYVTAGIQASGNERGILQAVSGLKGDCRKDGSWLRKDSTLAVLILSDEDNCSLNGQDCFNYPWAKGDYLLDYLSSIRTPGIDARVYGLIWHPSVASTACKTAHHAAPVYADVIEKTDGAWGSICDSDYTDTLKAISLDISKMLAGS